MRKRTNDYTEEQVEDMLYLLEHKYMGDKEGLIRTWVLDYGALDTWLEGREYNPEVPAIDELKADAYRQLKACLSRSNDPQKIANTIKILEDMKERDTGRGFEETAKGVSESIASLAADAPPQMPEALSLTPVVADHVKVPRRRKKAIPSKEVNGLDENSDSPRERLGGAEEEEVRAPGGQDSGSGEEV